MSANHFLDDRADDTLLEASIRRRRRPDGLELFAKRRARARRSPGRRGGGVMGGDLRLDLVDVGERAFQRNSSSAHGDGLSIRTSYCLKADRRRNAQPQIAHQRVRT